MDRKVGWVVLAALVLSLAAVSGGNAKPHPTWDPKTMFPCDYPLPIAVGQLPVRKPHFWINITFDTGTLTMAPKLPLGNENPLIFMERNWKKYNTYGHEALQWLEDHQLGRTVRRQWPIKLDWWGKEFWPRGAKGPEQTFRAKAAKKAKAHSAKAKEHKPGKKHRTAPGVSAEPKQTKPSATTRRR